MEQWRNGMGEQKYSEKTCPTATLFTTNPTWTGMGLHLGLHSERPASNRLSRDTTSSIQGMAIMTMRINLMPNRNMAAKTLTINVYA